MQTPKRNPAPVIIAHPKQQTTSIPQGADTSASDDAAISVTFTNYSTTTWNLNYWGYDYQIGFSGPSSEPSQPLDANDGQQTFAQSQVLSWLDQGPISVYCSWDDGNSIRFGIKLTAHFQMIGIGYRPTWQVSVDNDLNSNDEPSWFDNSSNDDPATPYTWDTSKIPYSIVATPDSEHTSLSVSIQIDDISASKRR